MTALIRGSIYFDQRKFGMQPQKKAKLKIPQLFVLLTKTYCMLRSCFVLLCFLFTTSLVNAYSVTFRLNLNGISGFETPEVNGTFNNWCGNCNAMTDTDNDGIWEATINMGGGTYEYKFSFDSWSGQENLSASTSCTVSSGNFTNRKLTVQSDSVLDVVCWGLCTNCIAPNQSDWTLSWADEFDGTSLNTAIWTPEIGAGGWGNNELQYYTANPQNLTVSNGSLKITALEETIGSSSYTSSRIITRDLYEFQYGKIESRIKIPVGQGIWPAFWMLGANFDQLGWPHCGEIDVMEHVNNESLTNGTVHWYNNVSHAYEGSSVPIDESEFHVYGAIWNETYIQFYVDDFIFYQFDYAAYTNSAPIFQKPFFFLLNVAVGGNWPGNPDASTIFPATLEVDYVRVYQLASVGLPSVNAGSDFKVYPNPLSDELTISTGNILTNNHYSIYIATGSMIASGAMASARTVLDTKNWPHGVYFLHIRNEREEFFVERLVK